MSTNLEMFKSLVSTLKCPRFEGYQTTYNDQITLFRSTDYHKQCPVMYEPGIYILLSGRKVAQINNHPVNYGPDKLLIVTSAYPVECEAFSTQEESLCGIYIKLDQNTVYKTMELLKSNGYQVSDDSENYPIGFGVSEKTSRLSACISRLLQALHDELETAALVQGILEELYFHLFTSEQGQLLVNFATQDGTYFKVIKAVNYINDRLMTKLP